MTCYRTLSLLDDLADGDLSAASTDEIRNHVDSCPKCLQEYNRTVRLKELLKQKRVLDPGRDYWSRTSQLVLARTVETPAESRLTAAEEQADQRSAFVRALVSLAASLMIFFSAILIGHGQNGSNRSANTSNDPVILAASADRHAAPEHPMVTDRRQTRLAKGMLLIGPPGLLGRFAGLTELRILTLTDFLEP